ncbi:hypothetical protein BVX97_01785 [bacterium E08(2017)]|nr:hypothetical protein BVX97_01785 [bacterium E08(2017)]
MIPIDANEVKKSKAKSNVLFEDSMMEDWTKNWFLDGKHATVENLADGLFFSAGPITKYMDKVLYNAHHAVLWTKQEFEGDIRISYEGKRVDEGRYGNVLIYVQAQGVGRGEYDEDIYAWRKLREIPAMGKYFACMNCLSISLRRDLRLRRYPTRVFETRERLDMLIGEKVDWHGDTRDVWYKYEFEKRKTSFTFRTYDLESGKVLAEHVWDTTEQKEGRNPEFVEKGRIGIRHMATKQWYYRNFKVEQL